MSILKLMEIKMEEKLKEKLGENGQTMKWFYERYIKDITGLTYGGFMAQLNGYTRGFSKTVESIIEKYLSGE